MLKRFFFVFIVLITLTPSQIYSQIAVEEDVTDDFELYQNYPNPADDFTMITYSLSKYSYIKLQLYSEEWKLIRTIVSSNQSKGKHLYKLSTGDFEKGTYYCRLTYEEHSKVIKINVSH